MSVCPRCGSPLASLDVACPNCGEYGTVVDILSGPSSDRSATAHGGASPNFQRIGEPTDLSNVPVAGGSPEPMSVPPSPTTSLYDDTLLSEMQARWLMVRSGIYQQVDSAMRAGIEGIVAESRAALNLAQADQRRLVERLMAERQAMLAEVSRLRSESDSMREQLEKSRSDLAEAENLRHAAEQIRLSVLRDAQSHRDMLMGEVDRLMQQLRAMRGGSAQEHPVRTETPPAEPPRPVQQSRQEQILAAAIATEPTHPPATARSVSAAFDSSGRLVIGGEAPPTSAPVDQLRQTTEPVSTVRPPAPPARNEPPAPIEPAEPITTTVVVRGLQSLASGMLVRRALKSLAGVHSLSFPQFRDGTLTMQVQHELGIELAEAICQIAEPRISPAGTISDAQMEFEAAA
jgi:hypothetical protein